MRRRVPSLWSSRATSVAVAALVVTTLTALPVLQVRSQPKSPDAIDRAPVPAQPGAQEQSPDAPPAGGDRIGVPARVWAMRIAGGWEADGRKGFSRVIGTFEDGRQKLVVQWLAEPDGRVVNAVELDDEEAARLTFGDMRAEPEDRAGVTVFLDTLRDADGLSDTWVLVIGAPGEVRFGPATN